MESSFEEKLDFILKKMNGKFETIDKAAADFSKNLDSIDKVVTKKIAKIVNASTASLSDKIKMVSFSIEKLREDVVTESQRIEEALQKIEDRLPTRL